METTPLPKKQSPIYGILGRLGWMVVAFIAGIFVGMHQEWIPNMPWAWHPDLDKTPATMPYVPTSQATDDSSATTQETPPEHPSH